MDPSLEDIIGQCDDRPNEKKETHSGDDNEADILAGAVVVLEEPGCVGRIADCRGEQDEGADTVADEEQGRAGNLMFNGLILHYICE